MADLLDNDEHTSAGNSPRGSQWHRWDLHFHTPASFDYQDRSVTDKDLVESLVASGIRVVAITDHHTMDVERIGSLQRLGRGRLTVLPGIELRDDHGSDPVHYICIFPEDCDLDHVWRTFEGTLGLTKRAIQDMGGDDRVYVPIEKGAQLARQLGGVVSIHAGEKSNSIEKIKNREHFQRRIKHDITSQWVDALEIGQLKDIHSYLNVVFPVTGIDRPLLLCSDNHNVRDYSIKVPMWLRADPTFRGLLMTMREPRERVFLGEVPPEVLRVQNNPTKYLRELAYKKRGHPTPDQKWFDGSVPLSPGLIAVVGNKGSGKSALTDSIALVGGTKNSTRFSFLSEQRFRHPVRGLAAAFDATLTWESKEQLTKCLADKVAPEEMERVKYLPQDHVEKICNELASQEAGGEFERELKAVIFSHVPDSERLGKFTLDDLVRFRTDQKQKRIDTLLKELREVSRRRAHQEVLAAPLTKHELEERIKHRESEIEIHDQMKPKEVINPAEVEGTDHDEKILRELRDAERTKAKLGSEIAAAEQQLKVLERRKAVAARLLEKLTNFQKECETFALTLRDEATELGLNARALSTLQVNTEQVEDIVVKAAKEIQSVKERLNPNTQDGLMSKVKELEGMILGFQAQLNAPSKAYQEYLKSLNEWTRKGESLVGSEERPDSLVWLKGQLTALSELPGQISEATNEQMSLAKQIFEEKDAQVEVYRELYGPVQRFINEHPFTTDKIKLEFRAELRAEDFGERLMNLLALNRRGSFMGVDEGRERAEAYVVQTDWNAFDSIRHFLKGVDEALHVDLRDGKNKSVLLADQLSHGVEGEDVLECIYGLEYVKPRYVLKWEGKDLSMLSPGERGTLLLVFYLLIDKSDVPLVIDQPEGNLDNHTITKILIDCIREARKRRQVMIVTHNPNLAVVCDADQIIYAEMDKLNGNAVTYRTGSLENPAMAQYVTDVLEGTRWAFDVRGKKYDVSASV